MARIKPGPQDKGEGEKKMRRIEWGNSGITYIEDNHPVYRFEFPVGPQGPVDGTIGSPERAKLVATIGKWVDEGIAPVEARNVQDIQIQGDL